MLLPLLPAKLAEELDLCTTLVKWRAPYQTCPALRLANKSYCLPQKLSLPMYVKCKLSMFLWISPKNMSWANSAAEFWYLFLDTKHVHLQHSPINLIYYESNENYPYCPSLECSCACRSTIHMLTTVTWQITIVSYYIMTAWGNHVNRDSLYRSILMIGLLKNNVSQLKYQYGHTSSYY